MKKLYLLLITAILYLVLTGGISLANDSDAEAIEALKQAIRINPDDADAHYNLGLFYSLSNDKDSALEQCEILKRLDPELADKLFNLIYKQLREKQLPQLMQLIP